MRSRRAADNLSDHFDPSSLPPIAIDGGLELQPILAPPEAPPRLCEVGPCRHYHTFEIVMDSAKPMGGRLTDDGRIEGTAYGELHVERQHYCYPDVGIETDLGGTPVIECNRWRSVRWFAGGQRRAFETALDRWRARRQSEADTEADAIAAASADLADAAASRGEPTP